MKSEGVQRKHDKVATMQIEPAALQGLVRRDQTLFMAFGAGAVVPLPYAKVHHSFEAHAAAAPSAIAVRHRGEELSYGELNEQAERLADYLVKLGVRPGDNVGLFLQRSIPMVVGILATLKAGAAYVPQDARVAPTAQLRHVIKAAHASVILTTSEFVHLIPVPSGHVCVAIDSVLGTLPRHSPDRRKVSRLPVDSCQDALCFVLFTSGTTGNPNGVMVTHRNVCNILMTKPGSLDMGPGTKVAQILNIAFDMAAWEILGALSSGATLLIRGKDIQETAEQADVLIATPSILASLDPDRCRNVKTVAVAGEPCPKPLADRWSEFCAFYNSCGPTEVTIVNTMHRYASGPERISIGKPNPNTTVYILDENLQPCPIGEIGEMWAGGDCVTRGYIGDETLTAERYKPDPFLGGDAKMFRTRDLGRWTQEGNLEHFGRTDDQVKVRGFRVELDSISTALEAVPNITQAVTLKLDDRNLATFVTPGTVDIELARRAVSDKLPYYCMPSFIHALDELPHTSRGKVDKRLLTQMAIAIQEQGLQPRSRSGATTQPALAPMEART